MSLSLVPLKSLLRVALFAFCAVLAGSNQPVQAQPESSKILDDAAMFSPAAIRDAQQSLKDLHSRSRLPVTIQSRKTAGGESPDRYAINQAKLSAGEGLYVLILKDDRKIEILWSGSFKGRITTDDRENIRSAISQEFKKGDFDAGLKQALAKIAIVAERFPATAPGQPNAAVPAPLRAAPRNVAQPVGVQQRNGASSSIFGFLLLGLGFIILIGVLRSLFGGRPYGSAGMPAGRGPGGYGPGYGGPGYGGGGGGFFSGMLGGLGGAILGNWAYDRLSGHGHHDQGQGHDGSLASTTGGWGSLPPDAPAEDSNQWYGADSGGDWGQPRDDSSSWSGGDSGGWSGADSGGDWSGGGGDFGGGSTGSDW